MSREDPGPCILLPDSRPYELSTDPPREQDKPKKGEARVRKVEYLELVEQEGRTTLQPYTRRRPIQVGPRTFVSPEIARRLFSSL